MFSASHAEIRETLKDQPTFLRSDFHHLLRHDACAATLVLISSPVLAATLSPIENVTLSVHSWAPMFRLDYISCLLTVISTILVGRRVWSGWLVAGANSVIICVIAVQTSQTGFIPANLFCIALYGYNVRKWRMHSNNATASR